MSNTQAPVFGFAKVWFAPAETAMPDLETATDSIPNTWEQLTEETIAAEGAAFRVDTSQTDSRNQATLYPDAVVNTSEEAFLSITTQNATPVSLKYGLDANVVDTEATGSVFGKSTITPRNSPFPRRWAVYVRFGDTEGDGYVGSVYIPCAVRSQDTVTMALASATTTGHGITVRATRPSSGDVYTLEVQTAGTTN